MADRPDTEAIAARVEKATSGEWAIDDLHQVWGRTATIVSHRRVCMATDANRDANADFIAHAKTDIPALLAALATAENRAEREAADAEKWSAELDEMEARCGPHLRRLAAAGAVIEAADTVLNEWMERGDNGCSVIIQMGLSEALANYHKATGPQAETEGNGQ